MRIAAILTSLLVLAGCATANQQGLQAMERGDLWTAAGLFSQAAQQGDPSAMNNLGVAHQRLGNRAQAVQYYTLAARYGNSLAQQNLIALGEPVPSADLAAQRAQARAASAAETANTMLLIQALQPRPAPMPVPVTCNSYRLGNSVQTSCN